MAKPISQWREQNPPPPRLCAILPALGLTNVLARQSYLLASLAILSLTLPIKAQAWSCASPDTIVSEHTSPLTDAEVLRQRSKSIATHLRRKSPSTQILVVGRFARNADVPFFHEDLLADMRAKYWPPAKNVQMPQTTTFSYLDAFRFDGHVIKNATLAPFSTARIDADVTIYASYEGKIQPLPPTDETVIGLLDTQTDNERFKLQTWICPRYHEISSRQLDDLLLCYQDGACS